MLERNQLTEVLRRLCMLRQSTKLLAALILLVKTIHLASALRPRFIRFRSRSFVPQHPKLITMSSADVQDATASEGPNYLADYLSKLGKDTSACIVPSEAVPTDALIVKSLLWTYQKQFPVLLVLSLADTVDKPKLAKFLQTSVSSKQMRMATPALVLEVTGQTVGNVSPIGHKQPVRTIVDEALIQRYNIDLTTPWDASQLQAQADGALLNDVMCYGGGGSNGFELQISLRELLYRAAAEVGPISSTPSADSAPQGDSASTPVSTPSTPVPEPSECTQSTDANKQPVQSARETATPQVVDAASTAAIAKSIRDLAIDKNGSAALITLLTSLSARLGDAQQLRSILDQGTASSGKTALHLASWKGSIESVRALLAHGADVNKWSIGAGNYGKTAIFYAITQCRDDVVLELLSHGANVKIVNNKGQTPRSLGPSHLAEDTILAIEKAESAQPEEWLNFYTSNYCEANTCFGDLDPRFHELGQELRVTSMCAENADLSPLPRSINATTFEFRRNHFKSYSKANHMVDELVVALMNCSSGANVKDVLIENENVEDALLNGVIDVAPTSTLVGYVTAVDQLADGQLSATVVPVVQYWDSSSPCGCPSWTLRSGDETAKEAVSVRLLVGNSEDASTATAAVVAEWAKSLRVGQLVVAKGSLLVPPSVLLVPAENAGARDVRDFAVRNLVMFNTSSNSAVGAPDSTVEIATQVDAPTTTMMAEGSTGDKSGQDVSTSAEQNGSTCVSAIAAESSPVLEYLTLADVADSFLPVQQQDTETPRTVPVIVVNNLDTILALEKDIAEMVSFAVAAEHHTHLSSGVQQFNTFGNKLRTVVAIDCEWWSGQDYNKLRQARSDAAQADASAEVSNSLTAGGGEITDNRMTTVADVDAVGEVPVGLADEVEVEVDAQHDAEVDASVAIMQLGTRRAVYLIDLQTLCASLTNTTSTTSAGASQQAEQQALLARLNAALEAVFSNGNILKLGFKVAPDFEKVCASYPAMSCFQRIHGVMDTHTMTQQLVPALIKAKKLPADWHAGHKLKQLGLSKLCQLVMHKSLDKTQQCSTWHLRPLTPEQLVYGALDVATVLHIFDFFAALEYPAGSPTVLTSAVLRQHKLYRVFTANLKFYLPSLSTDTRITATPLRTLHHLLLAREHTHSAPAIHVQSASQSLNPGTRGIEMPKIGTSGHHKSNKGSASCKKIVGLDMVAQSWTAQQEEPMDYGLQLQELLKEGQFTAESLAEVAAAEARQLQQQQRFKGRLSDMYSISAPVTEFLQQYRDGTLCNACLSDTLTDSAAPLPAAGLPFLGQFIAQSKETCVDFCQVLLQLQTPTEQPSSAPNSALDSTINNNGAAGKKNIGGMVLLNNTLILFVHCAALKTTVAQLESARDAPAARKTATKSAAKAESNAFLSNGRYFTWSIEASAVVKDNSPRVSKIRSLLLQSLIVDGSGADPPAVNSCAGAVDQQVLLFVRQNAAPYVFCGRCSVASLETQLGAACSASAALAPNGDAKGTAASVAEVAVKVLFQLTDYEQLCAGSEESISEYASMIAQHTGTRLF